MPCSIYKEKLGNYGSLNAGYILCRVAHSALIMKVKSSAYTGHRDRDSIKHDYLLPAIRCKTVQVKRVRDLRENVDSAS